MLRSFQYKEKLLLDYCMQNTLFREKEIEIARKCVDRQKIRRDMNKSCPICGSRQHSYFFTKWDVDYLCCNQCKSVFAVADSAQVQEFQNNAELLSLRRSEEYQKKVAELRMETWQEFVEWVQVRAFRFIHRNSNLTVIDEGNRFQSYSECIRESALCGSYELQNSILECNGKAGQGEADIVLYLDQLQKAIEPKEVLKGLREYLKPNGLLFLNTRAGSGFDILTLKGNNDKIYPFEHVLLPSVRGLTALLKQCGFEVLEVTTPGVMDVKYVLECKDQLDKSNFFVQYLLEEADIYTLQEFQRFLQKGCLSSFVGIIAQRREQDE